MKREERAQIWELVHTERRRLIEDLSTVDPERWASSSGCPGWSIAQLTAHLIDNARTTRLGFLWAIAAARGDFDAVNERGVQRCAALGPAELLQSLSRAAPRRTAPPGDLNSRLVEEVVHGEDIRRPLGIKRSYPAPAVRRAAEYLARTPEQIGGAKQLVRKVSFEAEDLDLRVGSGPVICGPGVEVLMVLSGRAARPGSLRGPGLRNVTL